MRGSLEPVPPRIIIEADGPATDEAAKRDTRDNASEPLGVLDLDVPDCGVHAVGAAALR